MQLRDWRTSNELAQSDCAISLRLEGGARSFQRIETGENKADADLVERIIGLTAGAVTADDMHQTRLAWLRANRPEKFHAETEAAA
jgi:hypothetical protein